MSSINDVIHGRRGTYLGPYRLLDVLGEGGTARVYLAVHRVLDKKVAIKTLLPQLACYPAAQEMFVEEARIASSIRHPNLVDVYDFATGDDGQPYCVMELGDGVTVAQRLDDEGPLALSLSLDIAAQITDAVAAVHAAGVLHRDLKTENILLAFESGRLVPKLIDFGIAKRMAPDAPEDLGVTGTPRTMAPEQVRRGAIDERTDIWALGVMLYEMMTAASPFPSGDTVEDDLAAILTAPPRPLGLEFPAAVRALVEACLSKDPAGRPRSAMELRALLEHARLAYLAEHEAIDRALRDHERSADTPAPARALEVAALEAAVEEALDEAEAAHAAAPLRRPGFSAPATRCRRLPARPLGPARCSRTGPETEPSA